MNQPFTTYEEDLHRMRDTQTGRFVSFAAALGIEEEL